jgi:hypothetical protein
MIVRLELKQAHAIEKLETVSGLTEQKSET